MFGRNRDRFLSALDRTHLEGAIRAAASVTSAPIRVIVLPKVRGDLAKVAELTAHRLGMLALPDRNGVLIVVVPGRREFQVWGDRAIHEKEGEALWTRVVETISALFRKGNFTAGLAAGVGELAKALAAHFPAGPDSPAAAGPETVIEE